MINGKKRSGKNFVGNLLNKYLSEQGYKVKEVSFAEALKEDVAKILGITLEQLEQMKEDDVYLESDKDCNTVSTIRQILQNYGMMRREENNDIWVEKALPKIFDNDSEVIIITDFRFENEYTYLYNIYSRDIHFSPNPCKINTIKIENCNLEDNDQHISENDLNDFDFDMIVNNDIIFNSEDESLDYFLEKFEDIKERLR